VECIVYKQQRRYGGVFYVQAGSTEME